MVQEALILALGEFDPDTLASEKLPDYVKSLYIDNRNLGVHSAAEWLLRG